MLIRADVPAAGNSPAAVFNMPALLVIMALTWILVRGVRESAGANNVMVLIKIAAILIFCLRASGAVKPGNWHPFVPNGFSGRADRRRDRVLHVHRLRFGLDRGRGVQPAAARSAVRHFMHADGLHAALRARSRWCSPDHANWNTLNNAAPVADCAESAGL